MDEAKGLHILTEIYKFSFSMKTMLADPEFVPSVQKVSKAASELSLFKSELIEKRFQTVQTMLDDDFINDTFRKIDQERTHDISFYKPPFPFCDDAGTSHLSILTADGAAVALTSSIHLKSAYLLLKCMFPFSCIVKEQHLTAFYQFWGKIRIAKNFEVFVHVGRSVLQDKLCTCSRIANILG